MSFNFKVHARLRSFRAMGDRKDNAQDNVLRRLSKPDKVIATLENILKTTTDHQDRLYIAQMIREARKDKDKALEYYEQLQ